MADLIERSAALRIIFDSARDSAVDVYQKVRELPGVEKPGYAEAALEIQREIVCLDRTAEECKQTIIKYLLNRAKGREDAP